jgi:polyphosphate glucokinase
MELAHLPFKKGRSYEDYVGLAGLERQGEKRWREQVKEVTKHLKVAADVSIKRIGALLNYDLQNFTPRAAKVARSSV